MTYFTAQVTYDRLTKLDKQVLGTGHRGASGRYTMRRKTSTTFTINIADTGHHSASGHHTMGREYTKH